VGNLNKLWFIYVSWAMPQIVLITGSEGPVSSAQRIAGKSRNPGSPYHARKPYPDSFWLPWPRSSDDIWELASLWPGRISTPAEVR